MLGITWQVVKVLSALHEFVSRRGGPSCLCFFSTGCFTVNCATFIRIGSSPRVWEMIQELLQTCAVNPWRSVNGQCNVLYISSQVLLLLLLEFWALRNFGQKGSKYKHRASRPRQAVKYNVRKYSGRTSKNGVNGSYLMRKHHVFSGCLVVTWLQQSFSFGC